MNNKRILNLRKYVVLAPIVFWVPDIVLHSIRRNRFGAFDVVCLTIFLPLLTCLSVANIWKAKHDVGRFLPAGLAAVLGIWLFGPLMIKIGTGLSGGEFFYPEWSQQIVLGTFFFPIATWALSAYDGTLGALVIATAALPLMSLVLKHKPQPAAPVPHTK